MIGGITMKKKGKSSKGLFSNLRKQSRPKPKSVSVNAQYKRPRGRPPKHSKWDASSGQYVDYFRYPKDIVKAANERLRKLEKVFKWGNGKKGNALSESSEIYQLMLKYKDSYHETKGKIYTTDKSGKGLRFINKSEFDKLSKEDKEYYIDRLIAFMESASSTKTGINEAHRKAYKSFMDKYGNKYPGLTYEQYGDMFSTYNSKVVDDNNAHYSYSDLSKALYNIRIDTALRDKQFDRVMKLIHSGKKEDWAKIDSKYKLRK